LRKVLRNGVFAVLPKPFDVGSPLADGAVRSCLCKPVAADELAQVVAEARGRADMR